MVAGPCCVFGATATDAPPDVVVGEGAASDGVASFDDFVEERGGTSSSEDDEELKITEIVSHRDTRAGLLKSILVLNLYATTCIPVMTTTMKIGDGCTSSGMVAPMILTQRNGGARRCYGRIVTAASNGCQ